MPPTTPPMIAVLLLLDDGGVPEFNIDGSVGIMVTMAVDTITVTSVPVPIAEVYDVNLADVIGVRLEVVVGRVVVVVVVVSAVGVVCEELLGLSRYSSSLLHRQKLS
jgi:hypothetical protein